MNELVSLYNVVYLGEHRWEEYILYANREVDTHRSLIPEVLASHLEPNHA